MKHSIERYGLVHNQIPYFLTAGLIIILSSILIRILVIGGASINFKHPV